MEFTFLREECEDYKKEALKLESENLRLQSKDAIAQVTVQRHELREETAVHFMLILFSFHLALLPGNMPLINSHGTLQSLSDRHLKSSL
jgi:hypothetical protein